MATTTVTADAVRSALISALGIDAKVEVVDVSGGCGSAFEVEVVSRSFAGVPRLARHRAITGALSALMPSIHALSIKKAATPEEDAANGGG